MSAGPSNSATAEEVSAWVDGVAGVEGKYGAVFLENGITGDVLWSPEFPTEDLRDVVTVVGDRNVIKRAIKALTTPPDAAEEKPKKRPKAPPKILLAAVTDDTAVVEEAVEDGVLHLDPKTDEHNPVNQETHAEITKDGIVFIHGENRVGKVTPNTHGATTPNFANAESMKNDGVGYEDLEQLKFLGKGAFGNVFKVRNKNNNQCYALKEMAVPMGMSGDDETTRANLLRELNLLFQCQHPNIVAFVGTYFNDSKLCICMEYLDAGSMLTVYKKAGKVPEFVLAKVCVAVCTALFDMKVKYHAIHRDIKPDNMLVNTKGEVKLCDFGISNFMEGSVVFTRCGTRAYLSPERVDPDAASYGTKADVWSLGISLVEMATGGHPYSRKGMDPEGWALLNAIKDGESPRLPDDGDFSDDFRSFVDVCLIKDVDQRADPAQLLRHPFITKQHGDTLDAVGAWIREVVAQPDPDVLAAEGLAPEDVETSYKSTYTIDLTEYEIDVGVPKTPLAIPTPSGVHAHEMDDFVCTADEHEFEIHTFYGPAFCGVCGELLWGIRKQGYQCKKCKFLSHKKCEGFCTVPCPPDGDSGATGSSGGGSGGDGPAEPAA